jgi:hypothetical protein
MTRLLQTNWLTRGGESSGTVLCRHDAEDRGVPLPAGLTNCCLADKIPKSDQSSQEPVQRAAEPLAGWSERRTGHSPEGVAAASGATITLRWLWSQKSHFLEGLKWKFRLLSQ